MFLHNASTLPHPFQLNGQVSIPPPPTEDFNALFGHVLPRAQTIISYWGATTYYLIQPSHPSPSTTDPPRRVILIHGVGTPAIGLLPLATLLAAASTPTTVLIYDNWGHGLSSTPLTPHVPGLFHSQILHLLSHLQWTSAHILGYSLGGIIAASFARYHASLVESLVLVAPAGLLRKSRLSAWARFVEWGGWGWGWEGVSARKIYGFIGPGVVEEGWEEKFKVKGLDAIPREAVQVWEREKHSGHMLSLISSYRYSGIYDSHDTYTSIAKSGITTLTLLGENDGFFEVEYMKKELELLAWLGKVQVVNGVGHGIVAEKTKEVKDYVLAFWDTL
ncbi:Alpha/Beta hydrolase protein [Tricladium varicosporioides]|nr:Alpha/Beta hydrolase protein [Hymenoscyphus varicosporioides]